MESKKISLFFRFSLGLLALNPLPTFAGNTKNSTTTPIQWVDPQITTGKTPIKAIHVNQLRQAIDQKRTVCGMPPVSWIDNPIIPKQTVIKLSHMAQLRSVASSLVTHASTSNSQSTPPLVFQNTNLYEKKSPIKAIDFTELRNAIDSVNCGTSSPPPPPPGACTLQSSANPNDCANGVCTKNNYEMRYTTPAYCQGYKDWHGYKFVAKFAQYEYRHCQNDHIWAPTNDIPVAGWGTWKKSIVFLLPAPESLCQSLGVTEGCFWQMKTKKLECPLAKPN